MSKIFSSIVSEMEIKGINNNNNIQLLAYKEIKELIVSIKLLLKETRERSWRTFFQVSFPMYVCRGLDMMSDIRNCKGN